MAQRMIAAAGLGFVASFTLALSVAPVSAQEIVGSAVVDGEIVVLFADGSWQYRDNDINEDSGRCETIDLGLSFCGRDAGWSPRQVSSMPDADQVWSLNDRTYAAAILEGIGSDDGMTLEFMRDLALENVAAVSGTGIESIPVFDVFESSIGDLPGETMAYFAEVDGLEIVFANAMSVLPDRAFQIVLWWVSDEWTEDMKRLTHDFLAEMSFMP